MVPMKTSLIIDDRVFQTAKREAERRGQTVSQIISDWARIGLETLKKATKSRRKALKSVSLGGPAAIDLSSRRDWMDSLDT